MINDIEINGKRLNLPHIMKRLNFVEEVGHFIRKFTIIYVENNQLFIGHDINKKKTPIEYEDMKEWINYYDRL